MNHREVAEDGEDKVVQLARMEWCCFTNYC